MRNKGQAPDEIMIFFFFSQTTQTCLVIHLLKPSLTKKENCLCFHQTLACADFTRVGALLQSIVFTKLPVLFNQSRFSGLKRDPRLFNQRLRRCVFGCVSLTLCDRTCSFHAHL